jgi:flagellar export protein FliJ
MTISLNSLQKITTLKKRITEQATWEYAESKRVLDMEYEKLFKMVEHDNAAKEELHKATTDCISTRRLHEWILYLNAHHRKMQQQAEVIAGCKMECEDKHEALKDRFLEEQMWMKLQERRREEHRLIVEQQAQNALDEAAAFLRSRAGR